MKSSAYVKKTIMNWRHLEGVGLSVFRDNMETERDIRAYGIFQKGLQMYRAMAKGEVSHVDRSIRVSGWDKAGCDSPIRL